MTVPSRDRRGFTLIETVVVVLIIGLLTLVILPRITGYASGDIRSVSRHLIGAIQTLRDEAEARQLLLVLNVNLKEQSYQVSRFNESGEAVSYPEGGVAKVVLPGRVKIRDVVTLRQGKVAEGIAYIHFFPSGRVEKSSFHLEEEGRLSTLSVAPFSGKIRIDDGYIEQN